jgi:beta-glucuronidase
MTDNLASAPLRASLDLTGVWRFQPDAYDDGERLGYAQPSHDAGRWRETAVPCAFDDCAPELAGYEGAGWFRRDFDLPDGWADQALVLRFEGVNYEAEVWLNGTLAGTHRGGFLRFELPVSGTAIAGRNTLVVRADNTRRHGQVPGKERGWRPYGGILREVALDRRPLVRADHVALAADPTGAYECGVTIRNDTGEPAEVMAMVVIKSADDAIVGTCTPEVVSVPAQGIDTVILRGRAVNVTAWTPDTPAMYSATVRLFRGPRADETTTWFGFRAIEARGEQLRLNGQPIRLRGFNRHEDSPRRGMLPDTEQTERDLRHMKELGANYVRLCHYPHHPSTLDLCDRLGLLAMAEIPLYWWNGDADGHQPASAKLAEARQQLGEMIVRDLNHPSIILWSVSNETHAQRPEVAAGNAELIAFARDLDPSRLATHASDHWSWAPDFSQDDVLSLNAYPSWDGRCWKSNPGYDLAESAGWWREKLAALRAAHPGKPILVTEFGYPALRGVAGGALGEDMQAEAIRAEAAAIDQAGACGLTLWCYADHPWPEEDFIKRLTNSPFGVVARDRRPKRACQTVRSVFGAPPVPSEPPDFDNAPVVMRRPHLNDIADHPFPAGYAIRPMRRNEGGLWEDVQRDAEPFFTIQPGLFEAQFGDDPGAIERRCYLIVGPNGCAVGTISAWYMTDETGEVIGRIHWVATRRSHQGLGLGKAGLSFALKQMARWHGRAILDTSTGRVGAIKMYLDAGFIPDLRPPYAREAWAAYRKKLDHPALKVLGA